MSSLDEFDLKILQALQRDATLTADALAEQVNLSRNACWRRVKRLEETGYLRGRVALVDPAKVGLGLLVIILIRTSQHDREWLAAFRSAIQSMPQITAAFRMSGDLDYVLHARVADVKAYDELYQRLIDKVPLTDVSASFVMEEIKETAELPLDLARVRRQARLERQQ
ncbi:MAG: Lrp/AsnC family transcriptional regulator [Phyllobacteriaceae bacterium]|nr:Lrp/AsnC family transcriptional regulator [Nitratireductor sp.]MCO5134866.1 Lrp/AsnC family transcriptional regulator [Phyllobacteriaceae bacterium]